MWNPQNRQDLLGNNYVFLKKYCTKHMREMIKRADWYNTNSITKIREAILKLTELMPDASHGSPEYCSFSNNPNNINRCGCPLIVCASLDKGLKLIDYRIGLCIKNNNQNDIFFYIQQHTIDWLSNKNNLINPPINRSDYNQIAVYHPDIGNSLPVSWEPFYIPVENDLPIIKATPANRSFSVLFNVSQQWIDGLRELNRTIKNNTPIDPTYGTIYPKFIQTKSKGNFKMRTLVNDPNEISTYQAELEKILTSNLNPVGSSRYSNGTIWYDPRNKARASNPTKLPNYFFPNYFGLGDHNDTQVVEVNITGNANGAFVHNTTNNDIELVHLGIQPRLLDWYRKNSPKNVITVSNNGKKTDVILIGSFYSLNTNVTISSVDFIDKLTTFIQNVKKFKDENPQTKPNDEINDGEEDMPSNTQKISLNTILYGPPGTGKTYNTIDEALKIIDFKFFENNKSDRIKLKEKFDELVNDKQIRFVTFHQSYSYEEFVEGIRAKTDDKGNISYRVEAGIFKQLCERASKISDYKDFNAAYDLLIKDLIKEKKIKLTTDLGDEFSISSEDNKLVIHDKDSEEPSLTLIKEELESNNEEHKNYCESVIKHLESEYGYDSEPEDDSRELEYDSPKKFVLIIDEINRGNISKIFGELITLIEDTKRAGKGKKETLTVTLPYSNESFSVPKNLYIIGTMNTADRSLALMDTALRRRFEFIEMIPKPEEIKNSDGSKVVVTHENKDIDIQTMLEIMNQRIEVLYDREHTLGHAFFMSLTNNKSTIHDLAKIFKNKIIPLLQEYFFEDWEKIRIVLGDDQKTNKDHQFVQENSNNLASFSDIVKTKYKLDKVKSYRPNYGEDGDSGALVNANSYIKIYPNVGTKQQVPESQVTKLQDDSDE